MLHGDLHIDNILQNGFGWSIIDPKGVIGYPINEVWTFVNDIEYNTQYIAEAFNYDVQYVRQWHFVHLILAACWNLKDTICPSLFLDFAAKTYPMIKNEIIS